MAEVSIRTLLSAATARLNEAGVPGAARDAKRLLEAALDPSLSLSTMDPTLAVPVETQRRFHHLLKRRLAREPMSHLLGHRAFWEHDFLVSPDVLDPRPETETLVAEALRGPFDTVLDLGTGSGAIILSLLAARPKARGVATDISPNALALAERNAARLGVADRVQFLHSDWFADVTGQFDLIVSNPPYIAQAEMAGLAPELTYEPRLALTDEADGLSAYRALSAGLRDHLVPGGRVLMEIGPTQSDAVSKLFAQAGLLDIAVRDDLDDRPRVVMGYAP